MEIRATDASEFQLLHFRTPETEFFEKICIKSETESLEPSYSTRDEREMDDSSAIVKTEYEFQSTSTNFTLKKESEIEDEEVTHDEDYEYVVHEYDYDYHETDDECDFNNDDDDDFLKDHDADQDDDDNEFLPCRTTSKRKTKASPKQTAKCSNYYEKRNILEEYMLRACPYCDMEFKALADWNTHMEDMHNHSSKESIQFTQLGNGRAKCNECETVIVYKVEARRSHVFFHLPNHNIYKCKLCSLAKFRRTDLLQHIEKLHFDIVGEALSLMSGENSRKTCPYCDKYVGVMMMISTHIQKEHADIYEAKLWYVCPVCGEEFAEEKLQKEHLSSVHQFHTNKGRCVEQIDSKNFRCLKCNGRFTSGKFSHVTSHAMTHLPYKCFKCRYCAYSHYRRWKVIKHICKGLLEDIKNNPNLSSKTMAPKFKPKCIRWDTSNKLFVCPKCGENFEEHSSWKVHMIKEHNFNDIESLNMREITTPDGERVISCNECERKFDVKNRFPNLWRHAMKHMTFSIYKCKLCGKTLESLAPCSCRDTTGLCRSTLYICPKCGKEFRTQGNWNQHMTKAHQLRQPSSLGFDKDTLKEGDSEVTAYKCSRCEEVIKVPEPLCSELMFKHAITEHMPFKCYKCSICGVTSAIKMFMLEHAENCKMEIDSKKDDVEAVCSRIAKCQCHVCGELAASEDIIRTHLEVTHQLDVKKQHIFTWFCTTCQLKFDTRQESFKHALSVHVEETFMKSQIDLIAYSCPVCNMKFEKKAQWDEHIYEQHALNTDEGRKMIDLGERFECLECNKVIEKKSSSKRNHLLEHLPFRAYKCLSCGFEFKKIFNAQQHVTKCSIAMRAKHSQKMKKRKAAEQIEFPKKRKEVEPVVIEKPKVSTPSPLPADGNKVQSIDPVASLTSMATTSSKSFVWNKYCGYMTYACPECNLDCATDELWHAHIAQQHNFFAEEQLNMLKLEDRIRKCNECNVLVKGGLLHAQRHKLTHMPYQSFICKLCNHRSRTSSVLIQHLERRHLKVGIFKCSICATVLGTMLEREEHVKREHADAKNLCKICLKTFSSQKSLKDHMERHGENREKFACGFCERSYYQKSDRKIHWIQRHPEDYAKMEDEQSKYKETLNRNLNDNKSKAKKVTKTKNKKEAYNDDDDLDDDAIFDFGIVAESNASTSRTKVKIEGKEL